MAFLARMAELVAFAAWFPVLIGLLGRLFFWRGQNEAGEMSSPSAHDGWFPIPDQEPKEGDPNYRPFEDGPLLER